MREKIQSIIICLMLIFAIFATIDLAFEFAPTCGSSTIYVPTDYPTIQDAINAAKDGDTVYAFSGTYYENVVVNKAIDLIGQDKKTTIIDGDWNGDVIYVGVNWVNITGFTLTKSGGNSEDAGIEFNSVQNCRFIDNNVSLNGRQGIYIYNSNYINIIRNKVTSNSGRGIFLDSSNQNYIIGNNASDTKFDDGIRLDWSSGNTIENNIASNNEKYGICLWQSHGNNIINNTCNSNFWDGIEVSYSSSNMIANNTFSNNDYAGINIDDHSPDNNVIGNTISSNLECGIINFPNSDGTNITGNNVSNNDWAGIYIGSSSNHIITANTVYSNNWSGIAIYYPSENNTITNNYVLSNNDSGLRLESTPNNTITGNNITNNNDGIYILGSSNTISSNNVSSNSRDGIIILGTSNTISSNNASSNSENGIRLGGSSNTITGNNVYSNNNSGIRFGSSQNNNIIGNNIVNNWDGIDFYYDLNNNVTYNHISSNNRDGIRLVQSSNINILGNVISDNLEGINVSSSSDDNKISGNKVSLNNNDGIRLLSSSDWNNIIANTIFSNSNFGFYLNDSTNNSIYHNNIINNTIQAYDGTNHGNRWDNGYPSGGNYWSDFDESSEGAYDEYNGEGQNILGSDGIVDNGTIGGGGKNPYVIDSDSRDNYPLIEPNKNYMILKQGWNLISMPLIQEEQNLTKVLKSIDGLYDAVQWYDITDTRDPWKHYKVGKPYGNDLKKLNEKMGFWIHITQPGDTIFFYNGTRLTENQNIALHPGWNLVGYPSLNNRDRTAALNNIDFPSDVDAIWTYNSAQQRWEKMGPSDYFEIGRGYYIHSKVTKVWDVTL